MVAQQSDGEQGKLLEELLEMLCSDWHGSVARSFDAAEAIQELGHVARRGLVWIVSELRSESRSVEVYDL